ncbi:uncharacterized protein LOC132704427 isoform X2 [Cylas formicarius]|uniref:uncharacterized protein LOC132704427 isoform X2 n=1 Tax=Cylas formicarius TaxID=197179 RepID=UPI0029589D41|nr:uncharacterized protein LOC132704427 isoform X2 [Cylas formicarius]
MLVFPIPDRHNDRSFIFRHPNPRQYETVRPMWSNLISTQVRTVATDKLDMDHNMFEVIRQVSRALSLFVMPQVMFLLVWHYEANQAKLIYAAVLLNIIPMLFLIKTEAEERDLFPDLVRYQTFGRFTYKMTELRELSVAPQKTTAESTSTDDSSDEEIILDTKSSQNVAEIPGDHTVADLVAPQSYLNPVNVQHYFQNAGVSILPGIPEENEEENDDKNTIDSKRLSKISAKLEEMSKSGNTYKFDVVVEQPDVISRIEYIPNFREERSKSFIDELKSFNRSKHWFACTPYRKYVWGRRLRSLKDFVGDNIFRPSFTAAKTWYFYPALTSKVIGDMIPVLYITLAPFMALERSWRQERFFTTENATFLLTYVAFAWCFFLLSLPLIAKMSNTKLRFALIFGLMVTGTSMIALFGKLTNDVITLSSLLFGVGYGIVSYTEKIVYRAFIGMRQWHLVRGPLEIVSGILIIVIYYYIYFHKLDLRFLLLLAALAYYFNACLWLLFPFVKCAAKSVKETFWRKRSAEDFFT